MATTTQNDLRLRISEVREVLDGIHRDLLHQISDAASGAGDMDWVLHCAKNVEVIRKTIRDLEKIEQAAIEVVESTLSADPDEVAVGEGGLRKLTITVTEGMINQNLLTLTEARNRGMVSLGEKFTIKLPDGSEFTTDLCEPGNRLRERGAIRRFYQDNKVGDGDRVTLSEVSPSHWTLSLQAMSDIDLRKFDV